MWWGDDNGCSKAFSTRIDIVDISSKLNSILTQCVRVYPDSKVHGANMGPIWGRQEPGGPHVGPMNFAIWIVLEIAPIAEGSIGGLDWRDVIDFQLCMFAQE